MRNLFLALVLANLGFAAWHAWFAEKSSPAAHVTSANGGITLVKELDAGRGDTAAGGGPASASAPTAAAAAAAGGPPGSGQARTGAPASKGAGSEAAGGASECVSVGPFRELTQAATASAKLRTAGYASVQRAGEGDVWVGYWVYIEAIPTQDEANRMLAKLHSNGVPDSYVIAGSDTGNLISLGVFTEEARADRLRDQVRALGYEPIVVDRTRKENMYWIDVTVPGGRQLDFDTLQTPGEITRLEQRPCPTAGD